MRNELTSNRPSNYSEWQRNIEGHPDRPGNNRWMVDVDWVYWCNRCREIFCILEVTTESTQGKIANCMESLGKKAAIPVFIVGAYGSGDGNTIFIVEQRIPVVKEPEFQTSTQHKNWVDAWYERHVCTNKWDNLKT